MPMLVGLFRLKSPIDSTVQKESQQRVMVSWLVVLVFYGPSTHFRSFRARSVNLATLFLGKPPGKFTSLPVLNTILSPVTDNCPSWISGRERMVVEMFLWPNLNERMFCRMWGSNPLPSAYQADAHTIALPRPANVLWSTKSIHVTGPKRSCGHPLHPDLTPDFSTRVLPLATVRSVADSEVDSAHLVLTIIQFAAHCSEIM